MNTSFHDWIGFVLSSVYNLSLTGMGGLALYLYYKLRIQIRLVQTLQRRERFADDLLYYRHLPDFLEKMIVRAEQERPGTMISIILLDPAKLTVKHQVSSSLLANHLPRFKPADIFPGNRVTGGHLMYPAYQAYSRGERSVIDYHSEDAASQDFLQLAETLNLYASWSEPVFDDHRSVQALLTLYYRKGHEPDDEDRHHVETLTRMINLALRYHHLAAEVDLRQALLEYSADPIYLAAPDENFRLCYVNQATVRHFGYSREETLKLRIQDYDPYATAERLQSIWQTLRQKQSFMVQSVTHTAHRRNVPVEVACHYFRHEGREYIAGYFREIVPHKTEIGNGRPD